LNPASAGFMNKKEDVTKLQAILDVVFKQLNRTPEQREQFRVWDIWEEVVGPQIAGKTRPEALRNGVLVVSVTSSVWMQELSFMKQKILDRINQTLAPATIREIRFKLGDIQQAGAGCYEEPLPQLTEEEQEIIAQHTASIEDQGLRESLQKLFTASRRRKKKGEEF
jgi:hypothetical protein